MESAASEDLVACLVGRAHPCAISDEAGCGKGRRRRRSAARSRRIFEVRVQRVHVEQSILVDGDPNRIAPDKWRPLIMSFQKFYGLEQEQLHESTLGKIAESLYRTRDVVDTARRVSRADVRQ